MAKYPDRYPRDNFSSHLVVIHEPTGYRFNQKAGRIHVWKVNASGQPIEITDFTTYDLQIVGTVLTEAALIRAAIVWLKNNS